MEIHTIEVSPIYGIWPRSFSVTPFTHATPVPAWPLLSVSQPQTNPAKPMLTIPPVRSGTPETILAELLAERSGVTVAPEAIPALVAGRIRQLGIDLESYARRVEADCLEHAVLVDLLRPVVTAPVSVAEQDQDLIQRLIPWAVHRQRNLIRPTLRIWVVNDHDGAAAWSISALLHRHVPERELWEFSILSTHPASEALIRTRVGR